MFKLLYSTFILYGIMIMTLTFFQSIGDAQKAGAIVLLRQLILFVPAMLIVPHIFGSFAVWRAAPAVDFTMILIGFIMHTNNYEVNMISIKPVSDLRNYNEVLQDVRKDSPVFLTKNGRGCYAVLSIKDYEKLTATKILFAELQTGENSAVRQGWIDVKDVRSMVRYL